MTFKKTILVFFFATIGVQAFAESAAEPGRPMGGWRYSQSDRASFKQTTNYPASRTNTGGHALSSLIIGDIKNNPKDSKTPHQLVVNGANMPLAVDEAGHFARPYVFGAGSNSIEIKNPAGESHCHRAG